jgi:hypothetical protein
MILSFRIEIVLCNAQMRILYHLPGTPGVLLITVLISQAMSAAAVHSPIRKSFPGINSKFQSMKIKNISPMKGLNQKPVTAISYIPRYK